MSPSKSVMKFNDKKLQYLIFLHVETLKLLTELLTLDPSLVPSSKPEKAANTFQAYQASVRDAWDIEVSGINIITVPGSWEGIGG